MTSDNQGRIVYATFGGVPRWLLVAYLEDIGGRAGDGVVAGEGWTARLADVPAGAGAPIQRVRVSIEGPAAGAVMERLRRKALRGGG